MNIEQLKCIARAIQFKLCIGSNPRFNFELCSSHFSQEIPLKTEIPHIIFSFFWRLVALNSILPEKRKIVSSISMQRIASHEC